MDRNRVHDRQTALGAWIVGCIPVLYLALRGGGWDPLVRGGVGIAVWWVLLLSAATGRFPRRRIGRGGWVCLALLAGFTVWTGLALIWTTSSDATFAELGREATYLGFLALALAAVAVGTRRAALNGLTCALGVIALLAVLSELYPGPFGRQPVLVFFPGSRLSYPLGYADADGELLALAVALLVSVGADARTLAGRALAAAAVPVAVLGLVMTGSRGGVLTGVAALLCLFLIAPDRVVRGASLLLTAAGSAVLVAAYVHLHAVHHTLTGAVAVSERHTLALVLALTCGLVGVAQLGVNWGLTRLARPHWLTPDRRRTSVAWAVLIVLVVIAAIAFGLPGHLSADWKTFKSPTAVAAGNGIGRIGTLGGSHRYQYWTVALHAFGAHPLLGIGPGGFQFYWAQHEPFNEYIQNAHSLYLETMAETGIVGIVLLGGMFLSIFAVGVRAVVSAPAALRASLAPGLAVFVGVSIAAAVDWVWQLPAMVFVLCISAAILLVPGGLQSDGAGLPAAVPAAAGLVSAFAWRPPAIGICLLALAAVGLPLAATAALRSSQAAAGHGRFGAALSDAETAHRLEPDAASPWAQRALIYEQLRRFQPAVVAIEQATSREPVDWQLWLIRARIEAERGRVSASVAAFRQAHRLDPLSSLTQIAAS